MRHFRSVRQCQFFLYKYKRMLPYFVDFDDDSMDVRALGLEWVALRAVDQYH